MSDLALRVDGLGKRYRLGRTQGFATLKEALTQAARARFRRGARAGNDGEGDAQTLWALRDATFEIRTGEVLGIVGRNGAGKSTLLKLLSRVIEPTEGRAVLNGRVGSLLEVGTGFHPELTGRENVFLNGAILGMSRQEIKARFDAIVDFAGIERFLDTPVKRYSHGMYMRLAFAVAAHVEPEILIVDEVLAVGDAAFQRKCLDKIRDAATEGRAVLFVSHNMAPIAALTSRCLLLESGRIALDDDTPRVVAAYLEMAGGGDVESDLAARVRPPAVAAGRAGDFTHVRVDGGAAALRAGRPLAITLRFRARDDVRNLAVGVTVAHPNGTRLFSARSDRAGFTCDLAAGREAAIHVRIAEPHLGPGLYLVHLDAFGDGRNHVDSVPAALRIDVMPDAAEVVAWQDASTGLWLPAEWRAEIA